MKALVLCSLQALCDISELEKTAFNLACAKHGIPANLTRADHKDLLQSVSTLDLLRRLEGSSTGNSTLIDTYLSTLNDDIWHASIDAHESVSDALLSMRSAGRVAGFVSDYPALTTNLARSSALMINATRVGTLLLHTDPTKPFCTAASLKAMAVTLKVACHEIEVLVANSRDFSIAQSLGMRPKLVHEMQPALSPVKPLPHRSNRATERVLLRNEATLLYG